MLYCLSESGLPYEKYYKLDGSNKKEFIACRLGDGDQGTDLVSGVVAGFCTATFVLYFYITMRSSFMPFQSFACVFICVGVHMCPSVHAHVKGRR